MARWNGSRSRRAFLVPRTLVLLLGLALAVPSLAGTKPTASWNEGTVVMQQAPVPACGHGCTFAILPCAQHSSCSPAALPVAVSEPVAPGALVVPVPVHWVLKLHLPIVPLHPPNRVSA